MATHRRITRKFFNVTQALEQILEDNEEVDNVVLLPPDQDGCLTDEDENEGESVPHDVPGSVEVELEVEEDPEEEQPPRRRARVKKIPVEWTQNSENIEDMPRLEMKKLNEDHQELVDKSPYELFMLYFDDVLQQLVRETNRFASQKNDHTFKVTEAEMKRFCGIFLLSGYHTLPQQDLYWCQDEDLYVPLVGAAMSRNRFKEIKKYLHMADNDTLPQSDKYGKIRPVYDILNAKLKQFGTFSKTLCVDEQMIP